MKKLTPIPEKPREPHPLEEHIRDGLATKYRAPTEELVLEPSASAEEALERARAALEAVEALLPENTETKGSPEGRQR